MTLRRASRGQAVVELAITLPVLALLALTVVQLAVVGRDQLAVWHAVRVAVRAAAVSTDPATDARTAAETATTLRPLEVSTTVDDIWVEVTVRHTTRTAVTLVGALVPDVTLHAQATMHREPP